jgi:hypothetical protein
VGVVFDGNIKAFISGVDYTLAGSAFIMALYIFFGKASGQAALSVAKVEGCFYNKLKCLLASRETGFYK